ncbi:MAG: hypothetical protein NC085_09670 [Muribaculaceae bacterium]|nr:hypothetical protein [Muribaculaceae bacterium]MCM1479962.1 hypothetical protein [Muribaculaceae bacterium]
MLKKKIYAVICAAILGGLCGCNGGTEIETTTAAAVTEISETVSETEVTTETAATVAESETAETDGGEAVPPDGDFLLEMFDIWWREDVLENGKSVGLWASPAGSAEVFYTDIDGDGVKEFCFIIDTLHGSNLYVCDYVDSNWKIVDALAIGNYTYLQTNEDGTTSLFVVRATRAVEGLDCYVYKNGVEEKFDILDEDKLYEELYKIDGMNEQEEFFHAEIQEALGKYDNLTNFYDLPYVYTAMLYDFRGLTDEEHRMAGFDEEQTRKEFDKYVAEVAGLFNRETEQTAETDYIKAYTEHLNNIDAGMYVTGIYLADINDDGIPEAVVEQNFGVFTDILYMNEKGMRTLSLEAVSTWGCIVCMPGKNAVSFTPMVGHTEGTAGNIERYLYEWDGAEYVLTTTLTGRESEGVYTGEINGVETDSAAFEAAVKEQSYDYEENIWITGKLIRLGDEGFEEYIKENFPGFDNRDII